LCPLLAKAYFSRIPALQKSQEFTPFFCNRKKVRAEQNEQLLAIDFNITL